MEGKNKTITQREQEQDNNLARCSECGKVRPKNEMDECKGWNRKYYQCPDLNCYD